MQYIQLSTTVQNILKGIFENYRLGFVGGNFSNSFLALNKEIITTFEFLPPSTRITTITRHIGDITYRTYNVDGVLFFFIDDFVVNSAYLSSIEAGSERERRAKGVRRSRSVRSQKLGGYVYARDGGTLNGIPVEIVKRQVGFQNGKPIYVENYRIYDNGRYYLLSGSDLKSASAFVNNQAEGWKCNGQRVVFDSSFLKESKSPNRIIIKESQLRSIIYETIRRILLTA